MEKISKFIKKNYVIISIVLGFVIIVIASIMIIRLIQNKNRIDLTIKNEKVYQYILNKKDTYDALISYQDDKIIDIQKNAKNIDEDYIVYYDAFEKVIFPKNMVVIFYNKNNLSYKLPKYSTVSASSLALSINSNGNDYIKSNFIVYDNEDLYFIPVASELKYNGKVVKLGKFSYVEINQNYIMYYNYSEDKVYYEDTNIIGATLQIDNYMIDLLNDVSVVNGNVGLLKRNLDGLGLLKED